MYLSPLGLHNFSVAFRVVSTELRIRFAVSEKLTKIVKDLYLNSTPPIALRHAVSA